MVSEWNECRNLLNWLGRQLLLFVQETCFCVAVITSLLDDSEESKISGYYLLVYFGYI